MTTGIITAKSTGLAKAGGAIRELASKIERARQSYNEKIVRAEAEYYAAVSRAVSAVEAPAINGAPTPEQPGPAASAASPAS